MNIDKISGIVLWVVILVSLAILGVFYGGGSEIDASGNDAPFYTETLIYWLYALVGIALFVTVGASLVQFTMQLIATPKEAMKTLIGVACFVLVVVVAWNMGDDTPLQITGYEGTQNTSYWLKITDMNLYSAYILAAIAVVCIVLGSIKKRLS